MKYKFMLLIAFFMAVLSSLLTAFGMTELFLASGWLILILFVTIDLGRFLLFNFVVDEWSNLRSVKYFTLVVLGLLFIYSGVGIYSKLSSLLSEETKQAMITMSSTNLANINAQVLQTQNTDFNTIAKTEYENALSWNKNDYDNCLARAKSAENTLEAENKCNNTKRRLDKAALTKYEISVKETKQSLENTEKTSLAVSQNQSQIASVLSTVCKFTHKTCTAYSDFEDALTIIILLVIIGTDYLQICIVLAINTRKNKPKIKEYISLIDLNTEKVNFSITGAIKKPFKKLKDILIKDKLSNKSKFSLTKSITLLKEVQRAPVETKTIVQDPITLEKKVVTKKIDKNDKKINKKQFKNPYLFTFSGPKPK